MKFRNLLYLIILLASCSTKVELTDVRLGGDSIYSDKIKAFDIGDIDSSETVIKLDSQTTLSTIERDLFRQDTCCSYSNPFTLELLDGGVKFKVNARLYRFCPDFYVPVGEQTYRSEQVIKIIRGVYRYQGVSYTRENMSNLFSIFLREDRFDDNICIVFSNQKTKKNEVREISESILNGYKEFISDLKIEDDVNSNIELIFVLNSYSSGYSHSPFLLQNEMRRLGKN